MKKNIAMRVAAFLFILTMISTCAFATTFAKYTTSGTATDTARVAKWGVTITASELDGVEYDTKGGTGQDAEITASAEKTLAPGSKVNFAHLVLGGDPEVGVKVTYEATLTLTNWKDADNNDYCPLVFVVVCGATRTEISKAAGESMDTFITNVQNAIKACEETYAENQTIASNLTVSCQWAYESGNDAADTHLGNQAAAGNSPVVSLSITCTVTQED